MLTSAPESNPVRRLLLTALTVVATLLIIVPATATAATLTPGAFVAGAGETNDVTVTDGGATHTWVDTGATILAAGGCVPAGVNPPGTTITCAAAFETTLLLSDMNDQTRFDGAFPNLISQSGGPGDDRLRGGAATSENDMFGDAGADVLEGGAGAHDRANYGVSTNDVAVSLNDLADDGESGENDNVLSSVENVVTGSGNDTVAGNAVANQIDTGTGNDVVAGGAGDDNLLAGEGADTLDGGDGNDAMTANRPGGGPSDGSDSVSGGPGIDVVEIEATTGAPDFAPLAVTVTLDDVANDGVAGEGDNYRSDIEDVGSFGSGSDTITGSAAINILSTGGGDDVITGGAGNDVMSSGLGNDTIFARDGFADRVDCGPGNDTAVVDTLDAVGANCETVQAADVGNANEDSPPAVAFAAPAENALIPGGPSTVTVTATDDRGIARVVLIDDGRVVATDTTAPYAFAYRPTANDVGSNTLIAQAVDTTNQAGTAIRVVRVDRFNPARVTAAVTPSRDRSRPYRFRTRGTVRRPAGVTAAQGCSGTVTVTVKRGGRTISTRRAKLTRTCAYASTVTFGSRRRLGTGRLRITARFGGNAVLKARSSPRRNIRAG